MEQFELRFIVFGSDLASIRTCAKTLFEAPLPGKVSLRQEEKFLLGTVTIEYPSAASSDWQVALTSNLLTEIQFQERVEAVLNKLDLPYCVLKARKSATTAGLMRWLKLLARSCCSKASGSLSRLEGTAPGISPP